VAGPGNILIKVGADAGQAVAEFGKVNRAMGDTMSGTEKMSAGLKKAALPAAAALGAIGVAAIGATKAAMEDATAQAHLAGVLERTTGATAAQVKATEEWITKVSKSTGVADDKLRPALEKIVTATGDVTKSQKFMQQALDISAASGKDLDTVSAAIAKGYTGQTAALSKLIPGLSESAKKSKDFSVIMGELGDKTGGAMAKQTETATGQMAIMTNQVNELQESLGTALIPVVEAVIPLLSKVADFASKNTTAIKILVGVVAALAGGILIANAALKAYQAAMVVVKVATTAWTIAQRLLNFALKDNPIGVVITVLALLAAALVIAYKRSETFRQIVQGAMAGVKTAVVAVKDAFAALFTSAQNVFAWIRDHWKLGLFAFGPIGAAVYLITTNFDTLKAAATKAAGAIADAIRKIGDAIAYVIDKVKDLIGWLGKIHVPHIDLPGPFSLAAPAPAGHGGRAAPSVAAGGVTVNVFGAVDPDGTARAIQRTLTNRSRRVGYQFRTTAY
jgi:hypothetical protein